MGCCSSPVYSPLRYPLMQPPQEQQAAPPLPSEGSTSGPHAEAARPKPSQQPQRVAMQAHPGQDLESIKQRAYNEIMSHEQAHASAVGPYGGSIHIDYDSNGIAIAGHVPVSFPSLTPDQPEEALRGAQMIYRGALAPADPSGADVSVAATAQAIIGQAQVLINQKQLRLEQKKVSSNSTV